MATSVRHKTHLILSGHFSWSSPHKKTQTGCCKNWMQAGCTTITLFCVGPISSNLRHTPSPHTFLPDYIASMSAQSSLHGGSAGLTGSDEASPPSLAETPSPPPVADFSITTPAIASPIIATTKCNYWSCLSASEVCLACQNRPVTRDSTSLAFKKNMVMSICQNSRMGRGFAPSYATRRSPYLQS